MFQRISYFAFLVSVIIIFKIYIYSKDVIYMNSVLFFCFFTERHADFLSLLHTFNLLIRRKSTKTEFFLENKLNQDTVHVLLKWVTPLKWVFIHSHTLTWSFSRSRDAVPRVLSVVVMWRRLLRCHEHICVPAETCMHLAGASVAVASKVYLIFKHDLSQN